MEEQAESDLMDVLDAISERLDPQILQRLTDGTYFEECSSMDLFNSLCEREEELKEEYQEGKVRVTYLHTFTTLRVALEPIYNERKYGLPNEMNTDAQSLSALQRGKRLLTSKGVVKIIPECLVPFSKHIATVLAHWRGIKEFNSPNYRSIENLFESLGLRDLVSTTFCGKESEHIKKDDPDNYLVCTWMVFAVVLMARYHKDYQPEGLEYSLFSDEEKRMDSWDFTKCYNENALSPNLSSCITELTLFFLRLFSHPAQTQKEKRAIELQDAQMKMDEGKFDGYFPPMIQMSDYGRGR